MSLTGERVKDGHEVWFSSRSELLREFSNFHLSRFVLDGEEWNCVEQYYQCAKFQRDSEPYVRIKAQERPGAMKGLADHYAMQMRTDWTAIKRDVMRKAVYAKFSQNPQLMTRYRQFADRMLIHEARRDPFWGMNRNHVGENQLGKMVKAVCNELLQQVQEERRIP